MPRLPKPFRWRAGWYTDAGGKRTRLLDSSATLTAVQTALRQILGEHDLNGGLAYPTDYRTTKRYVHLAWQQNLLTDAAQRAVDALKLHKAGK